jgi:hypothetical protein
MSSATIIPSTAPLAEFAMTDALRAKCILVVVFSCCSCLLGLLVCYVYFAHSHYRVYLRSMYNNLVVGAIVLQLGQALCRIVAAGTLLAGGMHPWLCDALGGIEVFCNLAVVVLVIGFYYIVMALRYNPLRALLLLCMSHDTFQEARQYVWYVVSLVLGVAIMALSFVMLGNARRPGQLSYFSTEFGFCGIPVKMGDEQTNTAQHLLLLDYILPTMLLVIVSIASFVALRLRVSNMKGMTLQQSWPLYVRFFTMNVYFAVIFVVQSISFQVGAESQSDTQTVGSVTFSATLGIVSLSFLVSERLLIVAIRAFVFGEDDADSLTSSEAQLPSTTKTEASLKEMATGRGFSVGNRERKDSTVSGSWTVSRRPKHLLNGFTSCIQSLLVLEVEGIQVIVTNQDLLLAEQDALLTQGKSYGSRGMSNNMTPAGGQRQPSPGPVVGSLTRSDR